MSVETNSNISVEEKIRRTITWLRVPLLLIPFVILVAYLHDLTAFWYSVPVAIFGQLIQTWAGSHLHKDKKLTISGPYSHVRNPMYIGRFFLMLGFVMMLSMTLSNHIITAAYVVLFAAYAHMRVGREEGRLKVIFAPKYQEYCDEIRRWLPSIKPYSGSESRRASLAQVRENNEDIHLIALLVILAAVYARIAFLSDLPKWF